MPDSDTVTAPGAVPVPGETWIQPWVAPAVQPTSGPEIESVRAGATIWARSAGLIAGTPTNGIKFVAEQRSPPRWLDRQQQAALKRALERMLEYAKLKARLAELEDRPAPPGLIWARRDVILVQLMLHTGLRVEEVTTLNVEDIELRGRSGRVTVMGKGNKQRAVPLNAEARAALSAWLKARPETDAATVFVGRQGKRLGKRAIQRVVSRIGKVAGVEDLTPHVLRHSFAKNLVDAGVGLEKVADLMGHSRLDTTRIYTRPGRQDLEQAVEAVVAR